MERRAGKSVVVVGGGASGLAAAIVAAGHGGLVTLLERNERVGKKLLATGNGRCNFSNEDIRSCFYRSRRPEFVERVLGESDDGLVLNFMKGIGVLPRKVNGYYYPASNQAASVVECLAEAAELAGVRVVCEALVQSVLPVNKGGESLEFEVWTLVRGKKELFKADRVILAAGSKAAVHSGADGGGYELAASLGHSLVPVAPALVQLRADKGFPRKLAGIRCEAEVSLLVEGQLTAKDRGELQLTDYGISGIVVFQLSRFASYALMEKKDVKAVIDFAADWQMEELRQLLAGRCRLLGHRKVRDLFVGMLNKKLGEILVGSSGLAMEKLCKRLKDSEIGKLAAVVKDFEVAIADTNGFDRAQVCAGGVDLNEIRNDMESELVKHLYICGEMMDVDGICGGYNLHWAFLSGIKAGRAAVMEKILVE